MNQNLEKIEALVSEYHSICLSKKRIASIDSEIKLETKKLHELKLIVDKEYLDVLKLEEYSIKQLFVNILKDNTKQFEKERQEYLLAVLNYKEYEKIIELLNFERKLLLSKVDDEAILLKAIERELNHFDEHELFNKSRYLAEFKEVNIELQKLLEYKFEVIEALELAQELKRSFNLMISFLTDAQSLNNWGKFYHEIKERKIKRKTYLDKAQSEIYQIQKLLIFLNNELEDVIVIQNEFHRTQALVRSFNIKYYNDLIKDWINDNNLINTMSSTMGSNKALNKLVVELDNLAFTIESEYKVQISRRSALVLKMIEA